jgi:formate dehydrogenase maturation protein FdhE
MAHQGSGRDRRGAAPRRVRSRPASEVRDTVERMSCIRFSTTAQREAMRRDAATLAEVDQVILHRSPPVTDSKIARLRLLAEHARPGIRQSAASNRHAPLDLLQRLAADRDPAVRGEVAKNESTPADLVDALSRDRDARVRCWAVLNPLLADDRVRELCADRDAQVARLAGWRVEAAQPA